MIHGTSNPSATNQTPNLSGIQVPKWMSQGACVGHADIEGPHETDRLFFPVREHKNANPGGEPTELHDDVKEAMRFCHNCPVQEECLEWALRRYERGVWGGTTELQRNRIRRNRARRVAS